MRRSAIQALATVSLAALVSVATSSQAVATASLGTLKQLEKWKVGIVDPAGQSFCAMVGKFDKNVGLAFALSPDGYGSVAVDLSEGRFTPGESYDVSMKAGGQSLKYPSRATSDRSVVVQIGQNRAFYEALKGNAPLAISLPGTSADFGITQFSKSYGALVECAQTLGKPASGGAQQMPAVKVKEVEKAALAPLDQELAEISGGKEKKGVQLAAASAVKDKAAAFDNAEAQAAAVPAKADVVWNEPESAPKPERKLLATTKSFAEAPPSVADSGATAKLWDDRQQDDSARIRAEEEARKAELLKLAEEENKARMAVLEAVKREAAKQQVAAFDKKQAEIDAKAKAVQQQAAALEAEKAKAAADDKALKASIVAKQAEIAQIEADRLRETQGLTRKLAATQAEFQSQLSSVEAERDALKKQIAESQAAQKFTGERIAQLQGQLEAALAKGADAQKGQAKIAELSAQLRQAEQARVALAEKLAAAEQQNRIISGNLTATQRDAAELASAKEETSQLKARLAASEKDAAAAAVAKAEIAQAQSRDAAALAAAREEAAHLKVRLAASEEVSAKDAAASAAVQSELARLKAALAAAGEEKSALAKRLSMAEKQNKLISATLGAREKALEATAGAGKDLAEVKAEAVKLLSGYQQTVESLQQQLQEQSAQHAALEKRYQVAQQQAAQFERKAGALAAVEAGRVNKNASLADELARKEAQVAELEQRVAKLDTERAAAAEQAKPARKGLIVVNHDELPPEIAALRKDRETLAKAETRIAELERQLETSRAQSEDMQRKLSMKAGLTSLEKEQVLNDMRGNLEAAQREIQNLKAENKELSARAAAATAAPEQAEALAALRGKLEAAETEVKRLSGENRALAAMRVRQADAPRKDRPSFQIVNAGPVPEARPAPKASAPAAGAPLAEKTPVLPPHGAEDDLAPVVSVALSENPGLSAHETQAAAANEARRLEAIEPAAGIQAPQRRIVVRSSSASAPVPAARPAPVIVVKKDPSFDTNRAAAFLDSILAHHRSEGSVKPAPVSETGRIFATHEAPEAAGLSAIEAAAGAPEARSAPAPRGYSGHMRRQQQLSVQERPVVEAPVARVQQPMVQPIVQQPVIRQPVAQAQQAPAVAESARSVVSAPLAPSVAARPAAALPVEDILARAGISDAVFQPAEQDAPGAVVRQWTAGGISGMYEQQPAEAGFGENVEAYIARYREDCPALQASLGAEQKTATGVYELADVSCGMPGNSYTTSFVFWQDGQKFSAVLHSGYPSDAPRLKGISGSIARVLAGAGGLLTPQVVGQADAAVAAPLSRPQPQLRFNIPQAAVAAPVYAARPFGRADDGLETVVIE